MLRLHCEKQASADILSRGKNREEKDKMMFPPKEIVERIRQQFPSGCRIVLDAINDPYCSKLGVPRWLWWMIMIQWTIGRE